MKYQSCAIVGEGVSADRILINVLGKTGKLRGEINGTILAVNRDIELQCCLEGAVIAKSIRIRGTQTNSVVRGAFFVPEPSTVVILTFGMVIALTARHRI